MFIYFPYPYPNEDYRSVIFRYHNRVGNIDMIETKKELFDISSSKLGHFPRNISYLIKKLSQEAEVLKEGILRCTWYSLFNPFIEADRLTKVEEDILFGRCSQKNYVGRIAIQRHTPVLSKTINYCIECMLEDYERNGEVFAHLDHQVYFLDFCPIHLIKLNEKCPECNMPFSNTLSGTLSIKPCCSSSNSQKVEVSKINKLKLRLFSELKYFKKHAGNMESHFLFSRIIAMIGKNGYIDIRGFIDRKRLIDDLTKYFGKETLESVSIYSESLTKEHLAYFINQKYMSKFIILYLLVILFLEGTVKKWLEEDEYFSIPIPFGNGPWPCYNTFCPSYQLNSITKCKRTITGKINIGRFTCEFCGFVYTRKQLLEGSLPERFQLERWGFLLKEKVKELYDSGNKINDIAALTGTPIPTIKNFLKLYKENGKFKGIDIESNDTVDELLSGFNEVAASFDQIQKESYKEKISILVTSQKDLTRSKLKKTAPTEYAWILKNDRKWLDEILPPFKIQTLDYCSMDVDLRLQVRKAAKMLIASNPPTRIKQYSILNKLNVKDKHRILSHKEKLPLTVAELNSHIESIEDYQVRHIPSLFSQLKASGYVNVTVESILAFRRSYRSCTEETKHRIEKVLSELQGEE
ncbi:TnsD family Tn7-like transposition protein [Neobacillus drentensis]|uniref:TnsD family Tn7-like transposition protein n=1 Tax=Neobacillus drentensis TaxID=220684 RepID=UPI00300086D0